MVENKSNDLRCAFCLISNDSLFVLFIKKYMKNMVALYNQPGTTNFVL